MHDKSVFAVKLREIRERRNLSGSQFAKLLGIAQTTYSSYETGKVEPTVSTIVKIAKVLNVSSDILLGIGDAPENATISHSTISGQNVNINSEVVNGAGAEEIAALKARISELEIKLEYATELLSKRK